MLSLWMRHASYTLSSTPTDMTRVISEFVPSWKLSGPTYISKWINFQCRSWFTTPSRLQETSKSSIAWVSDYSLQIFRVPIPCPMAKWLQGYFNNTVDQVRNVVGRARLPCLYIAIRLWNVFISSGPSGIRGGLRSRD